MKEQVGDCPGAAVNKGSQTGGARNCRHLLSPRSGVGSLQSGRGRAILGVGKSVSDVSPRFTAVVFPLYMSVRLHAQSLQSCLTLCNPMDCSPPGSSVHGDSPGSNIGVGSHALPQGIFLIQGSNLYLLHCR